jgi:hypothetical protein
MRRATAAGTALALTAGSAHAHGVLQGAGDVYAGLLHPLVVPAEALALVAAGLLLGSSGLAGSRIGLPALAAGLAAGLALGRDVPLPLATPLLLAVALVAATPVVVGLRLPPEAAAGIAALAGAAVGIDARPDPAILRPLVAGAAAVLGATALATVAAGLVLGRERLWQRVAVRVAGSWISASAILYFAWLATGAFG